MESILSYFGEGYPCTKLRKITYDIARTADRTCHKLYGQSRIEKATGIFEGSEYHLRRSPRQGIEWVYTGYTFFDILNDDSQDRFMIEIFTKYGRISEVNIYRLIDLLDGHCIRPYFPKYCISLPRDFYLYFKNPFHALGIASNLAKGFPMVQAVESMIIEYKHHRTQVTAVADKQYNKEIGAPIPDLTYRMWLPSEFRPVEPPSTRVYELFKKTMLLAMNSDDSRKWAARMGPSAAMTEVIEAGTNMTYLHITRDRRVFTPQQVMDLSCGCVANFVIPLVKNGTPLSDGRARMVYAMPTTLEAYYRLKFARSSYDWLEGYLSDPFSQIDTGLQYAYDIKGCDSVVAPYWYKFCMEVYPGEVDLLYPFVKDGDRLFRPDAMPSGILPTALIINVFTYSWLKVQVDTFDLGRFQFQGDGMLLERPLVCELTVRRVPDGMLNGFYRGKYARPERLLKPVYMRGPSQISGLLRYFVRYYCYKRMNADLSSCPRPSYKQLSLEATPQEVAAHIQSLKLVVPKLLERQLGPPRFEAISEDYYRSYRDYITRSVAPGKFSVNIGVDIRV